MATSLCKGLDSAFYQMEGDQWRSMWRSEAVDVVDAAPNLINLGTGV